MPEYFTGFSVELKNLPQDQIDFLTALSASTYERESEHEATIEKYNLQEWFGDDNWSPGIIASSDSTSFYLTSDEYGTPDLLAEILAKWQETFDIDYPVEFGYANYCSSMNPDSFSGGAALVYKGTYELKDSYTFFEEFRKNRGL